ncbi:MAG: cytochrome C biogenesis protein [Candidatus Magasanikbacteria bacterium CG_4_9_14_0_2_um_filter_41_10]|uniref:Cytochrome C biogenesis protein n=1 Tax=Candidatus Magasanikbacteria bacterium CG_4_10_14_0_2_um_filter_41_31 TaxID=1974639 RepID=A0A2M7V3Y6_9BACT|nr:MAG: cytochrome C biogenesis protein [Candidatus Magasanikbacteria bacterium CG_4_10_14_0_2_um_filter_41_31]PJC53067.1 MAG: cytochrome C biogenesis protein [Candidatus Magasanikbacteria bacterium CG_4_9_14_0_2_um_filter_41_10]
MRPLLYMQMKATYILSTIGEKEVAGYTVTTMDITLIVPVFLAGLLTFFAPCTLPLVPGYLGFISGVTLGDIKNGSIGTLVRKRILINGLLYVIGFGVVFVLLGTAFGASGAVFGKYRLILSRVGGVVIILFGLFMLDLPVFKRFSFLQSDTRFHMSLKPGKSLSSLLFGATFAFGWTPCVGPILGTVLVLAANGTTASQGAFLLAIFSLGLALPFLTIAFGIGHALQYIQKITKYLRIISIVGGGFLVFIGVLLLFNKMGVWTGIFYQFFDVFHYTKLLEFM